MRTYCLLIVLAGLVADARPASAQHGLPPAGVFFDDFAYRSAAPPVDGPRPTSEQALFGTNPWCLDLDCRRTVVSRAWYWSHPYEAYFLRVPEASGLDVSAAEDGRMAFVQRAGRHWLESTHIRQVASGFTARTGVWAARVTFSALPNGLPEGLRSGEGAPGRAPMIQAFWLVTPFKVVRTDDLSRPTRSPRFATTELDFEFNNWFFDAGRSRYLSTGFYENDEDGDGDGRSGTFVRLQAPGGDAHSCLVRRARRGAPLGAARVAPPDACQRLLAGDDPAAGSRVPVVLLFRVEEARVRFEVVAAWHTVREHGELRMATPWYDGPAAPSQVVATMFSHSVEALDGASAVTVPSEQRFEVDWAYYTPDHGRSVEQVLADVAAIRRARTPAGAPVRRLFTVAATDPARALAGPYRPRQPTDGGVDFEPVVARDAFRIHGLDGPHTAPMRGTASGPEYVARLGPWIGDFVVEWRYRPVWADGTSGAPTAFDSTPGVRWRPVFRFPDRVPPCARIEVRATRLRYHSGPSGAWWTRLPEAREQDQRAMVTCAPGVARPPGL